MNFLLDGMGIIITLKYLRKKFSKVLDYGVIGNTSDFGSEILRSSRNSPTFCLIIK